MNLELQTGAKYRLRNCVHADGEIKGCPINSILYCQSCVEWHHYPATLTYTFRKLIHLENYTSAQPYTEVEHLLLYAESYWFNPQQLHLKVSDSR